MVKLVFPTDGVKYNNENPPELVIEELKTNSEDHSRSSWRNRLYRGNNLYVLHGLLLEFENRIDLIYIDPPFATGTDFSVKLLIGESDADMKSLPNQMFMEHRVYRDGWTQGLDSYLQMMEPRLRQMHRLLSPRGTLYLHCDWRVVHYMKVLLDDIFGVSGDEREGPGFKSEIIWAHQVIGMPRTNPFYFPKQHETILAYSKAAKSELIFNSEEPAVRKAFAPNLRKSMKQDENGNWYYTRGRTGTKNEWAYDPKYLKTVVDPKHGVLAADVWDEWKSYQPPKNEKTGYATQKPEALIERIIAASSSPDSIVADFFCGSGTTLAVAQRLGRRWIGCDIGRYAIQSTRKRLLSQSNDAITYETGGVLATEIEIWYQSTCQNEHQKYCALISRLYGVKQTYPKQNMKTDALFERESGELVWIAPCKRIQTEQDLSPILEFILHILDRNLEILAWDFSPAIIAKLCPSDQVKLVQIPREILFLTEKEIIDPRTSVLFFPIPEVILEVEKGQTPDTITITIKDIKTSIFKDLPPSLQERLKGWSDYLDAWAIDTDYSFDSKPKMNPFHIDWIAFRTLQKRHLTLTSPKLAIKRKKSQNIAVKFVDIFAHEWVKIIALQNV
jgi:DNA modification methylase